MKALCLLSTFALLQDDSCTLKDCGVTATKTILVLGAANSEQQRGLASQEQAAQQAEQRTERLDRLRKAAKALAQRSASRCLSVSRTNGFSGSFHRSREVYSCHA